MLLRDWHYGVHVARHAHVVDDNDGLRARGNVRLEARGVIEMPDRTALSGTTATLIFAASLLDFSREIVT